MTHNGPTEKLAILDWGIGGMGLVKALRTRHLKESALFLRFWIHAVRASIETILEARVRSWTEVAQSFGAHHLVIACNAASSAVGKC